MSISTKPVSRRQYVGLSIDEINDELDRFDRAIAVRKRAIEMFEEIISMAETDLKRLDDWREIKQREFGIERSKESIATAEKEIKQLNQLRETFLSSRCADGEKYVLVD